MSHIQAIETEYNGYRFRSRLEARWAVFFDALRIEWKYEPEGFKRWEGIDMRGGPDRYVSCLPDFYLPADETWVEIKGSDELLRHDAEKIWHMLEYGSPIPGIDDSFSQDSEKGLLILGDIPSIVDRGIVTHTLIQQRHDGLWHRDTAFFCGREADSKGGLAPLPFERDWLHSHIGYHGPRHLNNPSELTTKSGFIRVGGWASVTKAYGSARQARFEHGQFGAPVGWR